MQTLLDGMFEAEEGFEEIENDEEFEDKEGMWLHLDIDFVLSSRPTERREY